MKLLDKNFAIKGLVVCNSWDVSLLTCSTVWPYIALLTSIFGGVKQFKPDFKSNDS